MSIVALRGPPYARQSFVRLKSRESEYHHVKRCASKQLNIIHTTEYDFSGELHSGCACRFDQAYPEYRPSAYNYFRFWPVPLS